MPYAAPRDEALNRRLDGVEQPQPGLAREPRAVTRCDPHSISNDEVNPPGRMCVAPTPKHHLLGSGRVEEVNTLDGHVRPAASTRSQDELTVNTVDE